MLVVSHSYFPNSRLALGTPAENFFIYLAHKKDLGSTVMIILNLREFVYVVLIDLTKPQLDLWAGVEIVEWETIGCFDTLQLNTRFRSQFQSILL